MNKKLSGSEKLAIVLEHYRLSAKQPRFQNVSALREHYQVSGEHIRKWRLALLNAAGEIYADKRLFRERTSHESEIKRLKVRIDQLEKETLWSDSNE